MEANREYAERLNRVIGQYKDDPNDNTHSKVLWMFFRGIADNCAVDCPVEIDPDGMTCTPLFLVRKDGGEHLVLCTEEDGAGEQTTAALKLQGLMHAIFSNKDCTGVVFNPFGEHTFFVNKQLIISAFTAGMEFFAGEKAREYGEDADEEADNSDEEEATTWKTETEKLPLPVAPTVIG